MKSGSRRTSSHKDRLARTRRALIRWGIVHAREFSWRELKDPYAVLLAEMLLRKTRAEMVERVFPSLLRKFPTATSMTRSDPARLEGELAHLGLQRIRARAVLEACRQIVANHGGRVPRRYEDLASLPHVGRYTANAVLCFGFNRRVPLVDVNIRRVMCRMFSIPPPGEIHKAESLWNLVGLLIGRSDASAVNRALLDLGALVCTTRNPRCPSCPLLRLCDYGRRTTSANPLIS